MCVLLRVALRASVCVCEPVCRWCVSVCLCVAVRAKLVCGGVYLVWCVCLCGVCVCERVCAFVAVCGCVCRCVWVEALSRLWLEYSSCVASRRGRAPLLVGARLGLRR